MSKPVILLDQGEFVGLSGAASGDVLTWDGTAWVSSANGSGTVTSVSLVTGSTGLTVSGGTTQTITGSGPFTLGGTLGAGFGGTDLGAPVVGDAGKVLAATAGGAYELVTNGNGTVTSVTAGAGLSGGTITGSGTISMPNVGTAASYGSASSVPVFTTDAQGRVSAVTATSIGITQAQVTDLVSDLAGKVPTSRQVIAGTGLSGGGALSSDVTLSLPSVGTAGEYGSASSVAVITTDAQGRVSVATTTAIAIAQSAVTGLVTDLGLKADKSVTATAGTGLTGGGTLGANFSFALDTVGTAQTSLGSASKTVTISTDAYGRVTSLSEQAIGSLPASVITSGQLGLVRGGTGIDASGVTGGQVLVGGTGVLALQSVSGDASLASTGALTVTRLQGNPVSATALGAPDAGKALIWSGTEWQASTIQGGGGGGGLTFFMNFAATSPYPLSTVYDENAGWNTGAITVDNTTAGTALGTFVTAVGQPAIEVIPAGLWDVNFYASSDAPLNGVAVRVKVAILAGATQTVIATSDYVYLSDPSVTNAYTASVYVPATDVELTDRVEIIFEGRRFGATPYDVTLFFGDGTVSHVHTTINAPGGTGLVKVVDGFLQSPATLLVNADVDAAAAIAVSKLAAGTDTYVLTTVSGVPTWSAPAATGVSSLQGTADQVLVGGTTGSPQTGALTLTLPQSIASTSSPTFAGLTLSGLTNGLVRSTSGVLSGAGSVSLTSEVSGTLGIGNGGTGLTSAGASGNLLVSNGSAWASVAMAGDATLSSSGALTLKSTGAAGTYGSASAVPVFVTDAQGRVTGVTNTNIAVDAGAITSGTLSTTRGGTGVSNPSTGTLLLGAGASAMTALAGTTVYDLIQWSGSAWARYAGQELDSAASPTFAQVNTGAFNSASGTFAFTGGAGTTTYIAPPAAATAGSLSLEGGAASSGNANGGSAFLLGGAKAGTGTNGQVNVGTTSTSAVNIGAVGITTTVAGTLAAVTAAVDTNTTQVATTAYVVGQGYLKSATAATTYAPIASPTFTGTVTLPLVTAGYVKTTSGGVISSSATVATADLSGAVAVANGGTNNASLSVVQGTVYYGDGSKLVGLAPGNNGEFLQTQGAGADPQWAAGGGGSGAYDLRGMFVGNPASSAVIDRFVADRSATISTTSTNHKFSAGSLPSAGTVVLTVQRTRTTLGVPSTVTVFTATSSSTDTILNGYYPMTISAVTNGDLLADDVLEVVVQAAAVDAAFATPVFTISAVA